MIKDLILAKINNHKQDDIFIETYHKLMLCYGWVPFEEYKRLPSQLVMELLKRNIRDSHKKKSKGAK